MDLHNPLSHAALSYKHKVKGEDLLKRLTAKNNLNYIVLYNRVFQAWGMKMGF